MKYKELDTLQAYLLKCSEQESLGLYAEYDQVNCLVGFLKFKTRLQAGMPYLNDLICKRNICPDQNVDIRGKQLLLIHGSLPCRDG